MMQSYVVCNPLLSPLCCSSSRGCFHIQRIVVCAQVQSLLILCWCRDVWLESNVNFDLSSGPKCWLTHCSMYAFTNCVIPWSCKFKANVKLVLQDTQHRSNVWISMQKKPLCVDVFLEMEGDTQCDHLLLATENFLPADGGLHGGRSGSLFWLCIKQEDKRARPWLWESWPVD